MKFIFLIFMLLTVLIPAQAMVWQVYIGANFFAPESLVVELGDTVRWTNLQGTHNVREQSDPPVFLSGDPAPPPWTYQFVFFDLGLGTYHYYCEAHGPGMSGSVTVIPYGTPPHIEVVEWESVPENATVGWGFRMTLEATDEEQDLVGYAASINDTIHFSAWSAYPALLIADTSLGLFPPGAGLVSHDRLLVGLNTLFFRAIDSRGYLSPIISRNVTMQAGLAPLIDTMATEGSYGTQLVYPDGSWYFEPEAYLYLRFSASASSYHGEMNAYRTQLDYDAWSAWSSGAARVYGGLAVGDHVVQVVARDIGGVLSDTLVYDIHLVPFALTDSVVIVDETRDGTGVPGSPNDQQVDDFYDQLFAARPHRQHDCASRGYATPLALQNAGLVMWHADDRADFQLGNNTRILSDYLNRGGRLIVSGWDLMSPFTFAQDSMQFSINSFPYTRMWTVSSARNFSRTSTGFTGDSGFPTCRLDSTKLPASWQGTMDRLWTFSPREQSVVVGRLSVSNSGGNPFEGRPAAYYYDGPFRVAVFGVPLYFCYMDQVQSLFDQLVPIMMMPSAAEPPGIAPPVSFGLEQNYPNPFNAATEIKFSLPYESPVRLIVYDLLGRQVATLLDQRLTAGVHHVNFDGSSLASGIYFVRLRSGDAVQSRKMVLLK